MNRGRRIVQAPELVALFAETNSGLELPKRLIYVYYCGICNSVLALRNHLECRHGFLFATRTKCPTCNFGLEKSLRCQTLNVRVPNNIFHRKIRMQNIRGDQTLFSTINLDTQTPPVQGAAWAPKCSHLSFGNELLDQVCGGVCSGQLAVLYGESACQSIAQRLCVRSQLPVKSGGFNAESVFIDGGNVFDVYQLSEYANLFQLDRDEVLSRINVSRAFTCYQLVNLILEKLPEILSSERVGLVVIASILSMFLDSDVDFAEAKQTVNFLSGFLARFAYENNVPIVVTCPSDKTAHEASLRHLLTSRARVVLKVERTDRKLNFTLERHPTKQWPARLYILDRSDDCGLDRFLPALI